MSDSNTPRPDSSSGDPADETGKIDPHAGDSAGTDPANPEPADPDPATGDPAAPGSEWRPVSGTEQGEPAATEQFATEPIVPGAQAYSAIPPSDADTAEHGAKPATSQFAPGEDPYGPGTASGPISPEAGGPTGGGPVLTSPRKKRSTGKIVAFSLVGVLLLVVIGAVGSELYLRNKVTSCLEESFSGLTGVPTEVALSRKPIILQGSGDIPFVQVDTDDSAGGVRLHMRADGISGTENSTDIQSLNGTGFIPYERIVELSKEQATGAGGGQGTGTGAGGVGAVEQITGNAADGTFEVQAAFPVMVFQVPVSATIKPVLNDGRVDFEVVKASALVFGIPPDFAQQIVDQVTTSSLGPFFDEVQVDSLKVTDTGLEFGVSGSDVQLTSEMTGTSSQGQSGGCSV